MKAWTVTLIDKNGAIHTQVLMTQTLAEAQTTAEALFNAKAVRVEAAS